MSQPRTGVNQKPLVFAQIRQGVSAPEVSKARVVESSRVIDISSNRFLHLFSSFKQLQSLSTLKLNLTLIGYNGCYEVNTFGINS